jgi:hypothetical protein
VEIRRVEFKLETHDGGQVGGNEEELWNLRREGSSIGERLNGVGKG